MIRQDRPSSFDKAAAETYEKRLVEFMKAEGCVARQAFSCDETGLFWKKMPDRTGVAQQEKKLPAHQPAL